MKKQYKAPLTEVVKINAEQMICESISTLSTTTDGSDFTPAGKDDEEFDENFW